MTFQVPSAEELKRIARANHIELTDGELTALEHMMPGQMAILEQIDAIAVEPQDSVTRYRDRKAGVRPSAEEDPLNAIVPRCMVKGPDGTIVERMLDAGAEIVATLNMDDFALSGDGRTSFYGPARNPHNPEYCAGGSSCGSAAALYYDDIDLTIGTDQGGSIRIPASWSGVVGIKPTYGLVPYTGGMSIDPTLG